ncbi:MAG: glycine-rich domain-containing protein [Cyanobacteriota bacterium]
MSSDDAETMEQRFARFSARTNDLDFANLRCKVMHPNPNVGYGWSEAFTDRLEAEYRIFFAMHAAFPELSLPPSRVMDLFWHEHILDTRAYFSDCHHVAGRYLHHLPSFGMRNPEDASLCVDALNSERQLYLRCVGKEPPRDLWIVDFTVDDMRALVAGRYIPVAV